MKKIFNKYSCVFFFLIGSLVVFADVPPPGGQDCCDRFLETDNPDGSPEYFACKEKEKLDPGSSCRILLPIDNSIYVCISMVAGVAVAAYVIIRKIKYKKTPI